MRQCLEKLWKEYFSDECAVMDTDEERMLAKKAVELHEKANALLNKEQEEHVEKYVDALCDIEGRFVKKHFSRDVNLQFHFSRTHTILKSSNRCPCKENPLAVLH